MTNRIALLGLSGVGKSSLIARLGAYVPILHLQASALIKAEQVYRAQHLKSSEDLRAGKIIDNQELMVSAFMRSTANNLLPVIFDGHSVIDGRDGLMEIPAFFFGALGLNAIFFLHAAPDVIVERRRMDASRVRPYRDASTLAGHQTIARDAALRIANITGCKFADVSSDDLAIIIEAIA